MQSQGQSSLSGEYSPMSASSLHDPVQLIVASTSSSRIGIALGLSVMLVAKSEG